MDPWNLNTAIETGENNPHTAKLGFQDTFLDGKEKKFEKLSDSQEYLKCLEAKLKKLEVKKGLNNHTQNKEEILGNLIRSDSKQILGILSDSDIDLDREIQSNLLVRQLAPKQPLTVGETVHLVKADQLDSNYSENQIDKPMSDRTI